MQPFGQILDAPARDLLPLRRRRVHPHPGSRRRVAAGADGGDAQPHRPRPPTSEREILEMPRRRAVRALPAHALPGQKRFSLEGAETLIPALHAIVELARRPRRRRDRDGHAASRPAQRARQHPRQVLRGDLRRVRGHRALETPGGDGDVKYHRGYSRSAARARRARPALASPSNPSHLEAVDPVRRGPRPRQAAPPGRHRASARAWCRCSIHGDAAFAGQGLVAETLNLSQLARLPTGGTVHLVVNNQIGFTTTPERGALDALPHRRAKMIEAPIFHVNGDDPEAVVHVAELALASASGSRRDVVIDLVCYRRHGHNEVRRARASPSR